MTRLRTTALPLLAATVAAAALFAACSQQGEGERCTIENGNDDCGEGLVCTSAEQLGGNADICCPPSGSEEPACIPGGLAGGATAATTTAATTTAATTGTATTATAATTATTGAGGAGGAGGGGGAGGTAPDGGTTGMGGGASDGGS